MNRKFIFYDDDGYEVRPAGESFELTCFEDIYLSTRQGVWIQQPDSLIQFRKDAARAYGEPGESLLHPESAGDMVGLLMLETTAITTDFSSCC